MKRLNKEITRCIILVLAILAFLAAMACAYKEFVVEHSFGKYPLLSPIINYDEWKELMNEKEMNFLPKIQEYVNLKTKDTEHISIYYRALNNGDRVGINEKEYFSPASLMKLPILLAYLKKAESEPELLDKKVVYHKDPEFANYKQNFMPTKELQEGNEYSIREYLVYMIKYSNNDASITLEDNIDTTYILKTFSDLWMAFPSIISWAFDNNIRVKDYATFFRILFNSSYLNKENSQWALELLSTTAFNDGLVAGLPRDMAVAHKFGERGIIGLNGREQKQLHDCGVVYFPKHPYIICIMTRGYDRDILKSTLKDISKIIFDEMKILYPDA